MMPWLLVGIGLLVGAIGTTVAVGAAAVSRVELTRWISRRLRGAAVASTLLARPGQLLRVATAVGTVGILVTGFGVTALVPNMPRLGAIALILLAILPAVSVITYGVPRVIGRRWCEPVVWRARPWMDRLAIVLRPLMPGFGRTRSTDLREVLRVGGAEDFLEPGELSVISGVLDFTRRPVRDVMTPRTDIVALPEGTTVHEMGQIFAESGYSRLPVYRESLDHILGMIHAFDVLKVTPGSELPMRPVTMTPGSKPCAELLLELQHERRQLAIVLDEFGGTDGIVTLEDLLELLVGDIFEEEAVDSADRSGNLLEVDGDASGSEITARFGVSLPEDSETIGGFLVRQAGRIPHPGDRFTLNGLEFDVLAASPTRIERIVVRRGPVEAIALSPRRKT
ncbi:MAG: hemolysin family protein [Gemmatimonadetes bacterium]|nr:hemolysin family protein [Gemmatimonadota bacterium]